MDVIRWTTQSTLDHPVMIVAFEGWNDAGNAASGAAEFLNARWDTETLAEIDAEEFYDFTTTRPIVQLDDAKEREIAWPSNRFGGATVPGTSTDVVVFLGNEPQLRWKSFCQAILDVATEIQPRLIVTLGALISDVPHSRPVEIYGSSNDPELSEKLSLEPSTYQGPTGIVGVLHAAADAADISTVSLWAAVPSYVPTATSPKATLALVERLCQVLDVSVVTTDLEIATAEYERQVGQLVTEDDETEEMVRELEHRYDELDRSSELVDEVEQFLRDQDKS